MNVSTSEGLVDPRLARYTEKEREEATTLSELNLQIYLQARARGESHKRAMQEPFVVSF